MKMSKFLKIIMLISLTSFASLLALFAYVLATVELQIPQVYDNPNNPTKYYTAEYNSYTYYYQHNNYYNLKKKNHILEEFFNQFDHIGVYYHNINSGFSFSHNGYRNFFAASLTKAPFSMYIYKKADNNLINLNDVHPFLSEYFSSGSGIIRHTYKIGAQISQRQLLAYNLFKSDNIALRMLRSIHGTEGFTSFVYSLGANPNHIHNITYSRTTARDAGLITLAMYNYIESGSAHSREFLNHLLNNHYSFFVSSYPIAGKTGWFHNFGGAWHEMAIIYAPSPFILVVLSNNYMYDTPLLQKISTFIEEFNSTWFAP